MAFFDEASIFEQDNGKRGKSWHYSMKHLSSSRTMESVESHGILRGSIYLRAGQWKAWKVMAFFDEASIFQQDNGKRGKSWHSSRKHLSSSRTMESVESHGIFRGSIYLPAGQWKIKEKIKLVRPSQLQRIICSICAVICEPRGEPAQTAYLCPGGAHTAYLYCNMLRGTLDGRTTRPCV